ncbi:DUF3022 domain-containing protein [Trinickia fusca]|uniref:DUF3022 domain-containing protein n=1 Tax=Trinickia fusca TaxID=2419777 RepID=A0A494XPG9_9BURK|nr:DUF3022 domain-containing protein [Trinickia fusca]RKP52518.1 DUF3022 domain-containing protein [Trinickia fusca]
MEPYRYECASAEFEELARVISDLFPEQTLFTEQRADDGPAALVAHWLAMRFGSTPKRMTLTMQVTVPALARYRALPVRARGRSYAVLRAFVEAALGSLEEQYASGAAVPREMTIELGDEFA